MAANGLQPEDVKDVRFGTVRWQVGYDTQEVDVFLDQVATDLRERLTLLERRQRGEDVLAEMSGLRLTDESVSGRHFTATRLRQGYAKTEVDEFLERVARELAALDRLLRRG
jgi:DivIVA domain-containing protein